MRPVKILVVASLILGLAAAPALAQPASNDDFDAAVAIEEVPFSHVVLTNEATKAPDDPDCSSGGRTVWYRFTPDEDIRAVVTTLGSNYDTTLGVYTGTRGALVEVGCNDDAFGTRQSGLRFEAAAGETYHVMVGSLATGDKGTLKVSLTEAPRPPANDDRNQPESISRIPFSTSLDTTASTAAEDDPDCLGAGNTVWYSFTAGKSRKLLVSVGRSDYPTVLAIYRVEGESLDEVECTDNATVALVPEAGDRYLVMVGSEYGYAGTLRLAIDFAPTPLTARATIEGVGKVSRVTGEARVHGTVTCSTESSIYLSGVIKQRRKQRVVSDDFGIRLDCKPAAKDEVRTWTLRLSGGAWSFHRGLASVELTMKATSEDDEATQRVRRAVSLRPCSCP